MQEPLESFRFAFLPTFVLTLRWEGWRVSFGC